LETQLRALGLDKLVETMPLGLSQPVGQTGWRLSQGEQARLILIRALQSPAQAIHMPDVLSALDPATAQLVLDVLEREGRAIHLRPGAH